MCVFVDIMIYNAMQQFVGAILQSFYHISNRELNQDGSREGANLSLICTDDPSKGENSQAVKAHI